MAVREVRRLCKTDADLFTCSPIASILTILSANCRMLIELLDLRRTYKED